MIIIENDFGIFCDVDETLVHWGTNGLTDEEELEVIYIEDVYLKQMLPALPHKRNIDLLKRKKAQGRTVVVWSAGGTLHAKMVVEALKLQKYVDVVMCKPTHYIDDVDIQDRKSVV